METYWVKFKNSVIRKYRTISDKTGEMTRIGRLKLEMLAVKREIEKAMIELGGRIFEAFEKKKSDTILTETEVLTLIELLRSKQSDLRKLGERIEKIRDQQVVSKE